MKYHGVDCKELMPLKNVEPEESQTSSSTQRSNLAKFSFKRV